MRIFLNTILLITLTTLNPFVIISAQKKGNINTNNEIIEWEQRVVQDTAKVRQLFESGYKFIDGPSDSLFYYFEKALIIIQKNLDEIKSKKPDNQEVLNIYQKLKTRTFIEFGIEYFYRNNYTQALEYFNKALIMAQLTENNELISECLSELGIVFKNQGDYNRALSYYNQALELAKQTTNAGWVASCQINMANVYKEKGFLNIAQKYYFEALKILEPLDEMRRVAACYQNIGDIYNKQRDYDKAMEYFDKSLELAIETNDKIREISICLNSGDVFIKKGQYETARKLLEKANLLYGETGYEHEHDYCYVLIGNSWLKEKDDNQAIVYFEKALKISRLKQDKTSIAEIEGYLGEAHQELNNEATALVHFKNSLQIAENTGHIELMIKMNANLSQLYENMGQPKLAFQYYKDYALLKDSLFNVEKYRSIKEMEVKYESEKKEQQLNLLTEKNEIQQLKLSRRNRMLFGSMAIMGLLVLIGFLLRKQNLLKAKHKAIELEQRLLRVQMNPHFIFNSLIAIQSYIYKKEPVIAGDYLAKFAELVRLILENSRVEFVSLQKENETMSAYLELQELRFENKFDYSIGSANEIEPEDIQIPPMFAQPFIENAIEHGFRHKTEKGHLEIIYSIRDKCCAEITIKDDGVGRKKAVETEKKTAHQSLALNITKERLQVLSKKYKYDFALELTDLKDDENVVSGTKVCITIPYIIV